jgi:ParB family chromosome partitioning protein
LIASDANMRRTARETGIDELAASIAAHGLLQNLTVRPARDEKGEETGKYEVVAGGRRLVALKLLAKRKAIAKAAPIACALLGDASATEVSLAENTYVPPHPADQYEAYRRLSEDGLPAVEIAARFGVAERVVKQRLRLGAVAPVLMQQYREGLLNLEQLMAFAITDDHARQEQVWRELSWNKSADMIRRLLTQAHVPATDRRVVFVGVEAYEAAGGIVLRDLFSDDQRGGYLEDVALLDRLVGDKLAAEAATIQSEGWKWIEVHPEFAYGMAAGMRRVYPRAMPLSDEEQARLDALERAYEALSIQHDGEGATPAIEAEFDRLEAEIDALRGREAYAPEDVARSGAFVCLGHDGRTRIERGFVRPEDEPHPEPVAAGGAQEERRPDMPADAEAGEIGAAPEPEEPDGLTPLSDRLVEELTAHRTVGLQAALMDRPDVALIASVHALAIRVFYGPGDKAFSCLKIEAAPAIVHGAVGDGTAAQRVAARHDEWGRVLPQTAEGLWPWCVGQDIDTLMRLLAYCAARAIDAVKAPWSGDPKRLAHADALAQAVDLDMAEDWTPTVDTYLGRVTKARILEAVREGASERDAETIAGLKKSEMAAQAERLLTGKRWLPAVLRAPRRYDEGSPSPSCELETRADA